MKKVKKKAKSVSAKSQQTHNKMGNEGFPKRKQDQSQRTVLPVTLAKKTAKRPSQDKRNHPPKRSPRANRTKDARSNKALLQNCTSTKRKSIVLRPLSHPSYPKVQNLTSHPTNLRCLIVINDNFIDLYIHQM